MKHPAAYTGWMQTHTGRAFYPLTPRVADVDSLDIAHALSNICRYGGHTRWFYSVAEHCYLMSTAVAPEHAAWALLHDAAEAYVGDMVRPLKYALPEYRSIEDLILEVIAHRFGLDPAVPPEVKEADNRILRDERDALMRQPPMPWSDLENVPALGVPITGWEPTEARAMFMTRMYELGLK